MRFIESFLLYCLLSDSPPLDDDELAEINRNQGAVASRGRDPELKLQQNGRERALSDWAAEILRGVAAVAAVIDEHDDNDSYAQAVTALQVLANDADATPSARIVEELRQTGRGFFHFALEMSQRHREYFSSIAPINEKAQAEFREEAAASLTRQAEIEAADSISLDEYLAQYFGADPVR